MNSTEGLGTLVAGSSAVRFDAPVNNRGYVWWYVDALSDDGRNGITLIAFIGSVFSPWYHWARRGGGGDPANHVSLNVALYGSPRRWAMTDRGRDSLSHGVDHLSIGPSDLSWDGTTLTFRIRETTAPIPRGLRGTVRVHPLALTGHTVLLDGIGRHRWSPLAPASRVEVELEEPSLSWSGAGYFDSNGGDEPLEEGFTSWNWSRATRSNGTAILYEPLYRRGGGQLVAIDIDHSGAVRNFEPPPPATLPKTLWRIPRDTRVDQGHSATVTETVVDAPFYSRSVLSTHLMGKPATAMHESVYLDRFTAPWVQVCLPWRVPRAIW